MEIFQNKMCYVINFNRRNIPCLFIFPYLIKYLQKNEHIYTDKTNNNKENDKKNI